MPGNYGANYDWSFLDDYIERIIAPKKTNVEQPVIEDGQDFYETTGNGTDDAENDDAEVQDESSDLSISQPMSVSTEDYGGANGLGEWESDWYEPPAKQTEPGTATFKEGVTPEGLSERTNSLVNTLSGLVGNFTVTSGRRSARENSRLKGSAKNSFHLTGDAVDIRPSAEIDRFLSSSEGKQFISESGYQVINERGKAGAAHWHLEPAKRQYGGGVPVARTKHQQFTGMNDDSLDELILPLQGTNTIRGLDSGEPVHVQDEHGYTNVLYGPDDTAQMKGKVYEKRKYR